MIFAFFLSIIFFTASCGHVSQNIPKPICPTIMEGKDLTKKISEKALVINFGGIFNQPSKTYKRFNEYFQSLGYECVSVDMPMRDTLFDKVPPHELGRVTLEDDLFYACGRVTYLMNSHPGYLIILVGHSKGGVIVQKLGEIFGNKVNAIVLLDSAAPDGISSFSFTGLWTFKELLIYDSISWRNEPVSRSLTATVYGVFDDKVSPEDAFNAWKNLVWESGRILWQLLFDKLPVNESKVVCPMLVIGATNDRLVPSSTTYEIAAKYKHSTLIFFEGPHYLPFDRNRGPQVWWTIDSWLRQELAL